MEHALELDMQAPLTLAAGDVLTLDGPDQQALLVDELRVYDQILTREQRQQLRGHNQLDDVCLGRSRLRRVHLHAKGPLRLRICAWTRRRLPPHHPRPAALQPRHLP
jgi:hypothetical protein